MEPHVTEHKVLDLHPRFTPATSPKHPSTKSTMD